MHFVSCLWREHPWECRRRGRSRREVVPGPRVYAVVGVGAAWPVRSQMSQRLLTFGSPMPPLSSVSTHLSRTSGFPVTFRHSHFLVHVHPLDTLHLLAPCSPDQLFHLFHHFIHGGLAHIDSHLLSYAVLCRLVGPKFPDNMILRFALRRSSVLFETSHHLTCQHHSWIQDEVSDCLDWASSGSRRQLEDEVSSTIHLLVAQTAARVRARYGQSDDQS